jgi:superfamily I DNA/RNA helicase
MTPSPYQQSIFNFLQHSTDSLIVEAVAGSGKTTTILTALDKLIEAGVDPASILFIAFNKNIADELAARVPKYVAARTFNSMGYRALFQVLPNVVMSKRNNGKNWKILEDLRDRDFLSDEELQAYGAGCIRLVDTAKQTGIGILTTNTDYDWQRLIDHYGIEFEGDVHPERAVEIAKKMLSESIELSRYGEIDFSDQLYLPVLFNVHFKPKKYVFVDEAQDVNAIQRALLKKILGKEGRLIAVGDAKQAIYGFRGSDVDALKLIQQEFNATRLPLSICYRCASSIVELAKTIVPQIEASPTAIHGYVAELERYGAAIFTQGMAILCRNNSPLIKFAYGLIARGVGCSIRGNDIGKSIRFLIGKMDASSLSDLSDKLEAYRCKQLDLFAQRGEGEKAETLEDQIDVINMIIDHVDNIEALYNSIENLFTDQSGKGVVLSSIHKAKGLEWNDVYFLDAALIPSKWCKQPWQLEQEKNLYYVAVTRAMKTLTFIKSDRWLL